MPKYNFMISRAVDLVARKLAGMDPDTISRLTQVLSEEAQMISEELQHSGQNVNSDILAARLEGVVARMKYEIRNQGPDPSPYEFPIFNVSHNPTAPYPNPINHLYDKRYKEAYSTFIKQNQPPPSTPQKNETPTPTTPAPAPAPVQPKTNDPNVSPSYPNYQQGQFQQKPNKQTPQSPGVAPQFQQQPMGGWQYMNPYATLPRSHAAHYQQQAAKVMQTIPEQQSTNATQPIRRSATGEDFRAASLSRSASSNDVNYSTNSGAEKIRVSVINDNSYSTTDPQTNLYPTNNRSNAQRSILKPQDYSGDNKEPGAVRTIYALPNTEIGTETMQDLLKIANNQRSDPTQSTSSPVKERIIIIDRRGTNTSDNNQTPSGQERYRAFEIRSSTAEAPTKTTAATTTTTAAPPTPTSPTPVATPSNRATSTPSPAYIMQQPNFYAGQQVYYQQPKMYSSMPNNLYSASTPYVLGANNFYPFTFYRY